MNGLFKVKHPPARNSTGLLGSTSSWALECYCMWKDETERRSDKHERGVQHWETTAAQRILICHKLWSILKTMADTKVWVNALCSALLLHSVQLTREVSLKAVAPNHMKCCRPWSEPICWIPSHLYRFRQSSHLGAQGLFFLFLTISKIN